VAIFGSASEGFSQPISMFDCRKPGALCAGGWRPRLGRKIPVRGYVSCVTDCPYDGPTPPGEGGRVAAALFAMGCYEISLGDTIGQGTPETVAAMLDAVLGVVPADRLAGHYHDTGGRALDNIEVSLDKGLRVFDAAIGGLGGCPYAKGATGNVATEAVADRLGRWGSRRGSTVTG
jgi:hydroxymethylglutaryl-CoA lyase